MFFPDYHFGYLYYHQNWTFCSIILFQVVRFEKFLHKQGTFLDNHFEYQQSYVIFKIEHFIPYFCLSQYYFHFVYISHIFYFPSAILIALNDNLELSVLCRLGDFFKDEIDMCSYSLLLVNSIFCCELCFCFSNFHVYARYM